MKKFILIIFITIFSLSCVAQSNSQMAENSVFEAKVYKTMPYRLFIPLNYDKSKKYPLVLWLHGAAGRGNDNQKQITGGNTLGATIWTRTENQTKNPAFVVAPQTPEGEFWTEIDAELKPSKTLEMTIELLKDLQQQYSIDSSKIYVAGQSMGGFGTWAVISKYPEMFAAAIPLCGGGNIANAKNLVNVPIWAFHGEVDETVKVERSREMIEAIKKAGGNPKYTEYKGVGHSVWIKAFAEPDIVSWLFTQTKN